MDLKVGDHVRIVGTPDGLDAETAEIFERCLGHVFPIFGFERGLVELEVGEAFGEAPYMRSIWIEPRLLMTVESQD